jgi:hypothetical protein
MTARILDLQPVAGNLFGWAARYAEHGLLVFPLAPRTKMPFRGSHGHLDATTDTVQIGEWWMAEPRANIGLRCDASRILVFDVDPRHGGDAADLGDIPDTWTASTHDGGTHHFFRCTLPDDVAVCGQLAPGIDVKWRGFVLLAPSMHPTGSSYRWLHGFSPFEVRLADLPAALEARVVDRLRVGCDRLRCDRTPLVIPEGERNVRLFKFACLLRRYGLGDEALAGCLGIINRAHCMPPQSDADMIALAAYVCRRYPVGDAA